MNIKNFGAKPTGSKKVAYERLKDPVISAKYSFAVEMHLMDKEDQGMGKSENTQQKWDGITEANRKAATEVIGYRDHKKSDNIMIIKVSREQKELGALLNSIHDPERKDKIRKARNQKLNEIHALMKNKDKLVIMDYKEEIENSGNDSGRMYKAVKAVQSIPKRKPVQIQTADGGIAAEPSAQVDIVTDHFRRMFSKEDIDDMPTIKPQQINPLFSKEEIKKAVKSLKNNKSAGGDELEAEQLKCGPDVIYENIADIFNTIVQTGENPKEIKEGYLIPLQKPGKGKEPPSHLRPIILLSMLSSYCRC